MSLRVWLPLNGDLKNQGLDNDIVVTPGGTVSYTTGKIGQAFISGGSTQVTNGVNLNSNLIDLFNEEGSIALWVKPNGTHVHYNGTFISSGNWNGKCWSFGVSQNNTQVDIFCSKYNTYVNCTVPEGEWTHLVSTYKNKECKLYKNGEYIASYTATMTLQSDATNTFVGRETYAGGYFGFNGLINDVRIYDHCLSPKEVKILAQGLVSHYPLNNNGWGNWNLALDTTTEPFSKTKTSDSAQVCYGRKVLSETLSSGATVTVSFQGKADPEDHAIVRPYIGDSDGVSQHATIGDAIHLTNDWKVYSRTITLTGDSTRAWVTANTSTGSNGTTYYIKNFKVELGDKATPWCVAQSEAPDNIVYDTSGYCFNGIAKGTLTTSSDTPRYNVSTYFGSGNNYIDIGLANIRPKDAITVSMWIKYTSWGTAISCTEGGGWNFEDGGSSNGIRFPVYVSSVGYKNANSGITTANLTNNGWHMLTGTFDTDNVKIYIDGILKGTTAKGSTNGIGYNASNHIHIGAEAAGGENIASAAYVGSISDVRIYCTALSAEDVLELYNIGASIDNDGNLYAAMIQES